MRAKRTERGKEIERDRESEEKEKQQGKTLTIELPDFLRTSAAEYLRGPAWQPDGQSSRIRAGLTFELGEEATGAKLKAPNVRRGAARTESGAWTRVSRD